VTDDIRTLTARVAEEPSSLAFLDLGEALRRRDQLDAAYKVARGGLARYPGLADAHDLLARILGDQGDLAGAFDAWAEALRFDPMRIGALKGIAFLYFRAGDVPAALAHLRRAADIDPDDGAIVQAIARVEGAQQAPEPAYPTETSLSPVPVAPAAVNSHPDSMLADNNGLRLNGTIHTSAGGDVGDRVAAELAGVAREAARTGKLLGLGSWQAIAVEASGRNLVLVAPTPETVLVMVRESSVPMARLALAVDRAAREARDWLGQHA
jgi:tetratricopeptide (TPR) repeat protein